MSVSKTDPKATLWELIEAIVGTSRRCLLYGPPGTGKTHIATHHKVNPGKGLYVVTVTEETGAAELRGHYIPEGDRFVWKDGPAISAWREGARLVINEINRASSDCLTFLYALLDDPDFAKLTLPTGETVTPAEGFEVIATMNGVPDDLPEALRDRFPVTVEVTEVHPAAVENLPEDLRELALATANLSGPRRISIRSWMEFASLRAALHKEGIPTDEAQRMAGKAIFGDRSKEVLRALFTKQQV